MVAWITTWANLGPIVSIAIAIAGFTIAIAQIRRSIGATQAAAIAVSDSRLAIQKGGALLDAARAEQGVQELKSLILAELWVQAHIRCQDLRKSLRQIGLQVNSIMKVDHAEFETLTDELEHIETNLEKSTRTSKRPPNQNLMTWYRSERV